MSFGGSLDSHPEQLDMVPAEALQWFCGFCLRKEPFSYLCLQIASKLLPCLNQMVLASGLPFHDFVLGLMLHMFIGMWSFMYEEARVMYIVYEVHFN